MQGFVSDFLFSFLPFYDLCAICPDSPKQGAMRLTEGVALGFFFFLVLICKVLLFKLTRCMTWKRLGKQVDLRVLDETTTKKESLPLLLDTFYFFFNISLKAKKKSLSVVFPNNKNVMKWSLSTTKL